MKDQRSVGGDSHLPDYLISGHSLGKTPDFRIPVDLWKNLWYDFPAKRPIRGALALRKELLRWQSAQAVVKRQVSAGIAPGRIKQPLANLNRTSSG
jgi:hypothetical protein